MPSARSITRHAGQGRIPPAPGVACKARGVYSLLKRILIGSPLSSEVLEEQRLSKRVALAVFGTDAVASTAFATQEILVVLVPVAGMAALDKLVPISLIVIALLAVVTASYRQTLYAYPTGGGSYIVSRENLGELPSLIAGSSLLVDYILTVAVSVSDDVARRACHPVGCASASVAALSALNPVRMSEYPCRAVAFWVA